MVMVFRTMLVATCHLFVVEKCVLKVGNDLSPFVPSSYTSASRARSNVSLIQSLLELSETEIVLLLLVFPSQIHSTL